MRDLRDIRADVWGALASLPEQEQRVALGVLVDVVSRLGQGQELYGPLDLARDERDWEGEAAAEATDGAIYHAMLRVQRLLRGSL